MARIIVCDDDVELYESLEDFLKSLGHEPVHVPDPVRLAELLRRQKPDLIIMDMQMPKGGGPQGVQTIEADPSLADVPILFCSGMAERHLQRWFHPKPNRRYIGKPVDVLLLKELIAELLKPKK